MFQIPLLSALSAGSTLATGPHQSRDYNAYPPRTKGRDQRALIKQAMDERFGNRAPEPDWMNSWGAVGKNLGTGAGALWDKMQSSNAAQAARGRDAGPPQMPALPTPPDASIPLPPPRPQSAPQGSGEAPWWQELAARLGDGAQGPLPPAGAQPGNPMDIRPPAQRGMGLPAPSPQRAAQPSFDPMAIPGFNPGIQNMANPSQMGDLSGLKARTIVDPNTGQAMNDFYREDLMSSIGALLKRAIG
jgi:hypothetical protein